MGFGDLISFYNVNTPEDLDKAEEILSRISNAIKTTVTHKIENGVLYGKIYTHRRARAGADGGCNR